MSYAADLQIAFPGRTDETCRFMIWGKAVPSVLIRRIAPKSFPYYHNIFFYIKTALFRPLKLILNRNKEQKDGRFA
jgi:hypothetical protein